MPVCDTDLIQLPELKMHYAHAGSGGNTVLFVHGYSASWRIWRRILERLPEDFRGIAVDVRGSGDSDKPDSGHTVKQMSDDIYRFAEAMNLSKFTLVGHSMGGAITINFALEHQDLLKSIIMVDPAPPDGLELPPEAREQVMAVMRSRSPEAIELVLRAMALAPDAQVEQTIVDELVEDALKASDAFLEQAMADLENLRIGNRLAGIDVPALMIHGDRDGAVPLAESIKTFENISGCSLQVFYGCGHSPMIESIDEFTALLVSFVRNPRRRPEPA